MASTSGCRGWRAAQRPAQSGFFKDDSVALGRLVSGVVGRTKWTRAGPLMKHQALHFGTRRMSTCSMKKKAPERSFINLQVAIVKEQKD